MNGKQRRHLRALGQRLTATVHVGHEGVTDAVVAHANAELDLHELIKVRIGDNAPEDRHDIAEALAERTQAHLAQVLGRTALLYRAREPVRESGDRGAPPAPPGRPESSGGMGGPSRPPIQSEKPAIVLPSV